MDKAEAEIENDAVAGLGPRVRRLRNERGITLTKLAEASQVSPAMLSHIERGRSAPSIKVLDRIRRVLGVSFGSFFDDLDGDPVADEATVITRRGSRPVLDFEAMGLTKELLSPTRNSQLELFVLKLRPGGHSGREPLRRSGEKCGVVLSGQFELKIGDQAYTLEEGDSFQFDSGRPHAFRNVGASEAEVVWIIHSTEIG